MFIFILHERLETFIHISLRLLFEVGSADGLMVTHWLGVRSLGLATGFPHRAFDQEPLEPLALAATSSTQTNYPCATLLYSVAL